MSELSRDEVVEILGPLNDVIIAEIIATGIGKAELGSGILGKGDHGEQQAEFLSP